MPHGVLARNIIISYYNVCAIECNAQEVHGRTWCAYYFISLHSDIRIRLCYVELLCAARVVVVVVAACVIHFSPLPLSLLSHRIESHRMVCSSVFVCVCVCRIDAPGFADRRPPNHWTKSHRTNPSPILKIYPAAK